MSSLLARQSKELSAFEARTGLRVTSQLREWLTTVNGAMVGPGGLFGVRGPTDSLSVERHLKIYPEWQQLGWLPIASDGLGNYWVVTIGPDSSEGWAAFIDVHADPYSIDYYAASSVFRFLNFVLRAELGVEGWPQSREYVIEWDPELLVAPEALRPWRHH